MCNLKEKERINYPYTRDTMAHILVASDNNKASKREVKVRIQIK